MGFDIGNAAENAASTTFGMGMGLLLEGHNDRRQLKQQQRLQDQQIAGQKQMTDYNMAKQYEMWQRTGYQGQKEQMIKAGLNPGLMYGMGGGGGQTAGNASGSVQGGSAPAGGREAVEMGGMGLQMALMQSQVKLMEAQANKTNVEAKKIGGVDTEEAKTRIKSLTQGIDNAIVEKELKEVQVNIARVEETIKGATQNAAIATIMYEMRSTHEEMEIIARQNKFDEKVMDDKIKMVQGELAAIYARNELTRAQTAQTEEAKKLTTAQIQNISDQIAIAWEELYNKKDQTAINKKLQEFETSFGGQASSILQSLLGRGRGKK